MFTSVLALLPIVVVFHLSTASEISIDGQQKPRGEYELLPTKSEIDIVSQFLEIVEDHERNKDNCTTGTSVNLGLGVVMQYGIQRFKQQALLAVNRANFLTRLWVGTPELVQRSQYLLYTSVRNMVESDPDIFAAGNCYDYQQFNASFPLFCPYSFRLPNGRIMVKDLALEYPYLGNDSEWFFMARRHAENLSNFNESIGQMRRRISNVSLGPVEEDTSLTSRYEDGHWSLPYFDCGGGGIWMMTYTVPFFGYDTELGQYIFKGTSGIDIALQKVDIDQCPATDSTENEANVFAGSDKCKKETTECIPVRGLGFRRGSYHCVCKRGFYFPDPDQAVDHFNGTDVELEYQRKMEGEYNTYAENFDCLPCAPGCEECTDRRPCVISLDWLQRGILLGITCFVMAGVPLIMWFVWIYREVKVMKASSPMLLKIILLGAFLMYSTIIVGYFEPSEITCSLRLWLRELGFSISYGALLLKTWRISVVFRVRSAVRIKISDTDLIKRLTVIVLLFCAWMSVRTVVGRPQVVQGLHTSGLKAFQCTFDVWDYCAAVAELLLLLWGIRLCIVVRKAPSEFNESRFISWAIYNETLLSLFLNISMLFLQSPSNPDLLYLVMFIHTQLTTTVTVAFLFGSKIYMVFKYRNKEQATTTTNKNRKYVAAPRGGGAQKLMKLAPNHATDALPDKTEENHEHQNNVDSDFLEEFHRVQGELEEFRDRSMKIGNSHLVQKLCKMIEAARSESEDSTPSSPNVNGKRTVISLNDYSEGTRV